MFINKRKDFNEGIVWWDDDLKNTENADVLFFIQDKNGRPDNKFQYLTLEHDLTAPMEEIVSGYSKNIKRNLKMAEKSELTFHIWKLDSLEDVEKYVELFNSFAAFKGLYPTSVSLIKQMADANKIFVTLVKNNGVTLQIHSHYSDGNRARLYHSFSVEVSDEFVVPSSNKFLTHCDIKFFKEINHKIYDMGGAGRINEVDENINKITQFKSLFGGKKTTWWKGTKALNEHGEKMIKKHFSK